jgi:hypothetical protein
MCLTRARIGKNSQHSPKPDAEPAEAILSESQSVQKAASCENENENQNQI